MSCVRGMSLSSLLTGSYNVFLIIMKTSPVSDCCTIRVSRYQAGPQNNCCRERLVGSCLVCPSFILTYLNFLRTDFDETLRGRGWGGGCTKIRG